MSCYRAKRPSTEQRLRSAAFDELLRIIREEEPPRPSTRLSTSESLPSIAANRQIEPKQLSALVRGELDWIVMKALEKDRTRRYETASKFAEDVQHYLNGDAVEACPPSSVYRFRKFVRRNKPAIATMTVVAATLLMGAGVATWQAVRATNERDRAILAEATAEKQAQRADQEASKAAKEANKALAEADKANAVVVLLRDMLSVTDPARAKGRDYTVRELIDEFSASLDNKLQGQPEVEMTLRQIIGKAYRELGHSEKAEPHLERSLQLHQDVFGEEHVKYADAVLELALNTWRTPWSDRYQVEKIYRRALEVYHKCGEYDRELDARFWLVLNYASQSRLTEAELLAEESLRLADQYNLSDSGHVTNILYNLSSIKNTVGDPAAAVRLARDAIDRCEHLHGDQPSMSGWSWFYLGLALRDQDNLQEAEECFQKSLTYFSKSNSANPPRDVGRAVVELMEILEDREEFAELQELQEKYTPSTIAESLQFAAHAELKWLRHPQRAIRALRKSTKLFPDGSAREWLGLVVRDKSLFSIP